MCCIHELMVALSITGEKVQTVHLLKRFVYVGIGLVLASCHSLRAHMAEAANAATYGKVIRQT